jgi:hypothetical protein
MERKMTTDMDFESGVTSATAEAVYREQDVPSYRGNPFIEALPPILDHEAATDAMQRLVQVEPSQREAPAHVRMHMVAEIEHFMQPLNRHLELFDWVSILIRHGYVRR